MDALKYRALKTIAKIAYEIAIGKRGISDTKDDKNRSTEKEQDN